MSATTEPGFGIYVHWPFCLSKCPYCDFNSHVAAQVDTDAWRLAFQRALAWFAECMPGRTVTSIFFGGGTPSLMPPALVEAVLSDIARHWPLADDVEITLEANPTSAEQENFTGFAAAGVNRLSLGVQALNDEALRLLGRQHTAQEAVRAFELAQKLFARASFDLIYARPGQTLAAWQAELQEALRLAPRHLSAYQLTMEPETPFFALHARGKLPLPDEESALALYDLTEEMLVAAGLNLYEVSNYAVPGEECRHNLLYWRYGPYIGVGPGAHSRIIGEDGMRTALSAERHPARWLQTVLAQGNAGIVQEERLTPEQVALEYLLMSLRTAEGADLGRLAALSGLAPAPETIEALRVRGLLHHPAPARITVTRRGRMLLEAVIADLAADLRPA